MKRIDWKVFLLLGIIVSVTVGFLYGTGFLGGSSGEPGSREDPLASTSYADGAINSKVRELELRIDGLEARITGLENEISLLTGEAPDPGTGGGAAAPPAGGGTTTPPATGSGASQANIGKSASVTAEVVNLRESASTSSAIKKKLAPTDTFTITKADKDWYQVQLSDGTVGWVFWNLVKVR